MSTLPPPRYTLLEAIRVAVDLARRALEEVRALARIPGPQGEQGLPGVCFDHIKQIAEDDGRVVIWQIMRGEKLLQEIRQVTCSVLDRGVWRDRDAPYLKGDSVTWAGSSWIAQTETRSKPGEGNDDWRLAVKRGRDGKDGKQGERGLQGTKGDPGRDGLKY